MSRLPVKLMHRVKRAMAVVAPWSELGRRRRARRSAGDEGAIGVARTMERVAMAERELDDAMEAVRGGDLLRASMAVQQARRHAVEHPRLDEAAAQVALAAGKPHEAVDLLDHAGRTDDRSRLLLAMARCQAGDRATATGELGAWVRSGSSPAEARVLLATLHLADGDDAAARRALGVTSGVAGRAVDPLVCKMLVLIDLAEDLPLAAERAAALLAHAFADNQFRQRWLATLGLAPRAAEVEPSRELVERLAEQLTARPELIATLTRAQREEPNGPRIRLIRRAAERLVDTLPHPMAAIESLAELAEIAGDLDDAARWARRGLRMSPYSAKLSLVLDRVIGDEMGQGVGEALDALERTAKQHTEYADVRRALILRYHRSGLTQQAVRLADRWVGEDADSQAAAATRREVAA